MIQKANISRRIWDLITWFFSFTSLGGKVERSAQKGKEPPMLVLQGENHHLIGSLTPNNDSQAKFGQLYIADIENEVENRAKCLR